MAEKTLASDSSTTSDVCRYAIDGDMTIYRVAELKQELLEKIADHREIEVDLSKVSEIDTAGLQLMVMAKLEASITDKVLSFHGHSSVVMEILDLSDLAGFFGDPVVLTSAS